MSVPQVLPVEVGAKEEEIAVVFQEFLVADYSNHFEHRHNRIVENNQEDQVDVDHGIVEILLVRPGKVKQNTQSVDVYTAMGSAQHTTYGVICVAKWDIFKPIVIRLGMFTQLTMTISQIHIMTVMPTNMTTMTISMCMGQVVTPQVQTLMTCVMF